MCPTRSELSDLRRPALFECHRQQLNHPIPCLSLSPLTSYAPREVMLRYVDWLMFGVHSILLINFVFLVKFRKLRMQNVYVQYIFEKVSFVKCILEAQASARVKLNVYVSLKKNEALLCKYVLCISNKEKEFASFAKLS